MQFLVEEACAVALEQHEATLDRQAARAAEQEAAVEKSHARRDRALRASG